MEYVFEWRFLSEFRMQNWMKRVHKFCEYLQIQIYELWGFDHRQQITFCWTQLHTRKRREKNKFAAMEFHWGQGFLRTRQRAIALYAGIQKLFSSLITLRLLMIIRRDCNCTKKIKNKKKNKRNSISASELQEWKEQIVSVCKVVRIS